MILTTPKINRKRPVATFPGNRTPLLGWIFLLGGSMSGLKALQSELTLKMAEIDAICAIYGYAATPTLLLRHPDGASSSILLGNDSPGKAAVCIAELGAIGTKSDQSPAEAILTLFSGGN